VSFPDEVKAAAGGLSAAALRLVDRVAAEPRLLRRDAFDATIAAARGVIPTVVGVPPDAPYPLQPWPVLITPARRAELETAVRGLARLVRSLPARAFGGDPAAIARFYGLQSEMLAALLVAEPDGLEETVCRGDMVDTPDGLRVVELNFGNVSGWQDNAVSAAYLASPPIAGWLAAIGVDTPRWDDTAGALVRHAVRWCASHPELCDGTLNLAVVAATGGIYSFDNHPLDHYRRHFATALAELAGGRPGTLHLTGTGGLDFHPGGLRVAGDPIHGVVEQLPEVTGRQLFRTFKAGRLALFTGPVGPLILGDKRNLALLSGRPELFTAAERELIERFVPWTRRVERRPVDDRGGSERALPELLIDRRDELVLKAATAVGGQGVVMGRDTEPGAWRSAVERALDDGGWVVQELLETPVYPFQHGAEGWAPHRLVWGPFLFGDDWGGLLLRVLPADRGRVVNLGRGGSVALAFEVAEG
jgi:hypothetical protein